MFRRRILFKNKQLLNPNIYLALRKDNVENWIDFDNGISEVCDFWSNDFPNLRKNLEENKASYRFEVIDTLGDKLVWSLHSAMGFVTKNSENGITDKQIKTLIEAMN